MSQHIMTQEEANLYWADKEFKKYVVTLAQGPLRAPVEETLYVGSTGRDAAIRIAKSRAFKVTSPARVSCRLATAQDLGCVRTGAPA